MEKSDIEPLRVGVVGLGKMGLLHASILNAMEAVDIVALCEKSSLIRRFAKKMLRNMKLTADVAEFADLDLDAIVITTPIPSHFAITKTIFTHNLASNLFIEKTLASNYADSVKLCELAGSSKGTNMVGYMKRFSRTFQKAKSLLELGTVGEISSFEAYAYSSDFADIDKTSKISGSRGGVLKDLGSHIVDIALWYFGKIEIESSELKSIISSGSEDDVKFHAVCDKGISGSFSVSWCRSNYRMPEFGLKVNGTKGYVRVNDDEVELRVNDKSPVTWYRHDLDDNVGFLVGSPEYYREDECFVKSVMAGRSVESDFDSASKVDYLLDQVKMKADWK
jgi:predicted dehydrogenase